MGIENQAQDGESDEKGEVDLKAELISALEELEKCRKKNQSNQIISDLKTQLQEAKNIEEDLDLQLIKRIQEYERLGGEIMHLRKKFDEESNKSKFENNSKTLDEILSSQISLRDKSGLGYDKEKKPECSSLTNQGRNNRSYVAALKSPIQKEEIKKYALSSHDKDRTDVMPTTPMTSRYK